MSVLIEERATRAAAPEADELEARAPGPRRRRLGLGAPLSYGWLLGPALLLVAWCAGSATGFIDARVLPAPWDTARSFADLLAQGRLQENVLVSAWRAAQGRVWGVSIGVTLALVSGLSLWGGYLFDGLVQV